jgi:hypothetical protein
LAIDDAPTDGESPAAPGAAPARVTRAELLVALAGFAALCAAVLTHATSLLEPDDFAYRASIAALAHGQLILSNAQYHALVRSLRHQAQPGIQQWVHRRDGRWISEKNPGYPFFAVWFYWLHAMVLAPLFYGAVASVSLFCGARRWLGPWGGTWAVALYCTSGAALAFAWRATMPTFTDASLVAAGCGALLWAMLAGERSARRRALVGLAGWLALEGAVFIRYTDVSVVLVVALAVALGYRHAGVGHRTAALWLGSLVAFGALLMVFNDVVYGGALRTGYASGEITFSLASWWPNALHMPVALVESMPVALVALVGAGWIAARLARALGDAATRLVRREAGVDAAVGLTLLASWAAAWGLYFAYTWTVRVGTGQAIHVIRFYLPALGPIALLGAWTLRRLPLWVGLVVGATLAGLGELSFHALVAGGPGPGGGPPGVGGAGGFPRPPFGGGYPPPGGPPGAAPGA